MFLPFTTRLRLPIWLPYVVAFITTGLTLGLRLSLGFTAEADPLLGLFILPILLCAYLGGFGPALLATLLAALGSVYYLLPPLNVFAIEYAFDGFQWLALVVAGLFIAIGSEAFHRQARELRQRAELIELANDSILVSDLNGKTIYWNRGAEKTYGWSRAQALGQDTMALLQTKLPQPLDDILAQVHQRGQWEGELIHTTATGSLITVSSHWSLQRDPAGRPAAILKINSDITDRVQSEQTQQYLAAIVSSSEDAIMGCTLEGQIVSWNPGAEQMFGYSASEAIGQSVGLLTTPDRQQLVLQYLEQLRQGHGVKYPEITLHTKTGVPLPVSITISPVLDAAHHSVGSAAIIRDISDYKLTSQTLQESQQLFMNIFHSSPTAIALSRLPHGSLIEVNEEFLKLTGFTLPEVVGRSAVELGIVADVPGRAQRITQAEAGQSLPNFEAEVIRKSGEVRSALISVGIIDINEERFALTNFLDVTDRKRAETQLNYQAGLLENVSDAIIATDLKFNITSWNQGATTLYGWTLAEVIGKPSNEILRTTYDSPDGSTVRQQFVEQGFWKGEVVQYHKDGLPLDILASVSLVKDSSGKPIGAVSVNRDISIRKQAEQALMVSEAKFRTISEQLADVLFVTDMQGAITYCSPSTQELFGWEPHEMLGRNFTQYLAAESVALAQDKFRATLEGGQPSQHLELAILRRDGSQFTGELSASAVKRDGQIVGIQGLIRDITERKHAEAALRAQTNRLTVLSEASRALAAAGADSGAVFESIASITAKYLGAGCLIRLLSPDGNWLDVVAVSEQNEEMQEYAQAIFGNARISINDPNPAAVVCRTGQSWLIPVIDHESMRAKLPPRILQAFDRYRPHSGLVTPLKAQAQIMGTLAFWRYDSQLPSFTQDDLILAQDLADRVALTITNVHLFEQVQQANVALEQRVTERTADLTRANAELVQARVAADQANAAKSDFLSRMSHELRTPLNAILGFAQLMEMDAQDARQSESTAQILRAGQHLLSLINEVLDLNRIESGKLALSPEPVLVDEIVAETFDLLQTLADKRHIQLHAGDFGGQHVLADRQRLKQVLVNLVNNAIKYSHPESEVFVSCAAQSAEHLRITIRDTGPGIAPEKLDRLFLPFERLGAENSAVEGTGLGLALSLRLVEAMRGALGVESQVNQGSTFWVELPIAENPVEQVRQNGTLTSLTTIATSQKYTALYIEDNLSNLQLIKAILEYRPAVQLVSADTGQAGLNLAQAEQPDLILLDLNLPDMHGLEILSRLQAEPTLRKVPIVVISADVTAHQSKRLLAAGARAFLAKPLDVTELLSQIDLILK